MPFRADDLAQTPKRLPDSIALLIDLLIDIERGSEAGRIVMMKN